MRNLTGPVPLDLAFKGSRDYLHGTDLFEALVALTGAREQVSFRVRKVMRCGLEALPMEEDAPVEWCCAVFGYSCGAERFQIGVRERPGVLVTGHRPYDEDAVRADAILRGDQVESPGPVAATFFERVLAINKLLMTRVFPEVKDGWLFTRLELDRVPERPRMVGSRFLAATGTRLVKTSVIADHVEIGYVSGVRRPSDAWSGQAHVQELGGGR
jgi:hypothetical protein